MCLCIHTGISGILPGIPVFLQDNLYLICELILKSGIWT